MYLIDTNVSSALRRKGRAESKVSTWAGSVRQPDLFMSAVTVLELEIGVLRMERRDGIQGAELRGWLDGQILPGFFERILPINTQIALTAARLHVLNPKPDRDALIAATALVHGLTVVTRNVADFAGTGVSILNPWM
jgi:hypothetical protein